VFEEFIDSAKKDFEKAQTKYNNDLKTYEKKLAAWTATQTANGGVVDQQGSSRKRKKTDEPTKPTPPLKPSPRMHEDEPKNFLRLSTTLKLAVGRSISDDVITRVNQLLHDYLAEFKRVRVTSIFTIAADH
jgi:hypothetical protein